MALKVLIADDHPLIIRGLTQALADQGFDVVAEADNGQAAVDAASEFLPDVIIMDVSLPGLDGIEATRRILAARPTCRILVLAADNDEDMYLAARASGAKGFMTKTATATEICSAVRALARGESLFVEPPEESRNRVRDLDRRFQAASPGDQVITRREEEVLQMFANGHSTAEVARELSISQKTVKNHLTSIYQKLDARDRTEAVLQAIRMGIISLERRSRARS